MQESSAMVFLQRNIRLLLEARGMTQGQLAEAAGIPRPGLNRILHGTEGVTVERADRIAKAFGITLSDLLDENLQKLLTVG